MRVTISIVTTALALAASTYAFDAARAPIRRNDDLHAAIRQGDISQMKAVLRGGADANSVDADKTPALMNAAMYGSAPAVRLLLDRGADPNARNATGTTALIWAAGDAVKARMLVMPAPMSRRSLDRGGHR